jgi:hypothetical protein
MMPTCGGAYLSEKVQERYRKGTGKVQERYRKGTGKVQERYKVPHPLVPIRKSARRHK